MKSTAFSVRRRHIAAVIAVVIAVVQVRSSGVFKSDASVTGAPQADSHQNGSQSGFETRGALAKFETGYKPKTETRGVC